jgi:hypothetical protein
MNHLYVLQRFHYTWLKAVCCYIIVFLCMHTSHLSSIITYVSSPCMTSSEIRVKGDFHPYHRPWFFYLPNNIRTEMQIMKLHIMQFCPELYYFRPLWHKYLTQQPVMVHINLMWTRKLPVRCNSLFRHVCLRLHVRTLAETPYKD